MRVIKGAIPTDEWDALTQKDEQAFIRRVKRVYRGYEQSISKWLLEGTPNIVSLKRVAQLIPVEPMAEAYRELYISLGRKYFDFTFEALSGQKSHRPKYSTKQTIEEVLQARRDPYLAQILPLVDASVAERVTSVVGTEREYALELIRESVEQGIAEGLGEAETAKLIERLVMKGFETTIAFRAQRIARTEVGTLANFASLRGAFETGVDFDKVWLTFVDTRARITHIEADNQRVSKDEYFWVGGEPMLYPAEMGRSAGNVINCRCRLGYSVQNFDAESISQRPSSRVSERLN